MVMQTSNADTSRALQRAGITPEQLQRFVAAMLPQTAGVSTAEQALEDAISRLSATGLTGDMSAALGRTLAQLPGGDEGVLAAVSARLSGTALTHSETSQLAGELSKELASMRQPPENAIDTTAVTLPDETPKPKPDQPQPPPKGAFTPPWQVTTTGNSSNVAASESK